MRVSERAATGNRPAVRDTPRLGRPRPSSPPRRSTFRRYWLHGLLIVVLTATGTLVTGMFRGQQERLAVLQTERAALEGRLQAVQERNRSLRREIERLQTDEYIETVAREQLGYVYPGEIPFMALEPEQGEP